MDSGTERRAMIALVAVFALLVQALVPSLASARTLSGPGVTICTDVGLAPIPADGGVPAVPDHGCDHCVCPSLAAALPALAAAETGMVRHAATAEPGDPAVADLRPGRGLAAPPPPSRGPPAPNA